MTPLWESGQHPKMYTFFFSSQLTCAESPYQQLLDMTIGIVHKKEEYWSSPEELQPSRFMPENEHKIVAGSFLPFSMGPRQCIGRQLAMQEMKIVLSMVFQRFRLTRDNSHPVSTAMRITLYPKDGIKVFLHHRATIT